MPRPVKNHATLAVPDELEAEFLADHKRLKSVAILAERWSIHYNTALATLRRLGVKTSMTRTDLEEHPMLGKMSDRALSRELGEHPETVRLARLRKGLPPFKKQPPGAIDTEGRS